MRRYRHILVVLTCLSAAALGGCRRNIVLAGPPASVATLPPSPPVAEPPASEQPEPTTTASAPAQTVPAPAPEPAPEPAANPAPAKPRPAPAEPEQPKPKQETSDVAAPQIAPQLSPQQLAATERLTNEEIRVAESNLQLAAGQKLNASQTDLVDKIRGFLDQAHDAIKASDWVRAENLAQKADILSTALKNSL